MMEEQEIISHLEEMRKKIKENSLSETAWANLSGYIAALEYITMKKVEVIVTSEAERIKKLIPKDPMAIIRRASERLRKELGEEVEDDVSEVEQG